MKTKGGICLDLKESEYKISKYGCLFYFSSLLYRDKFVNCVANYTKEENIKLRNKYKVNCDFSFYLAISFYHKTEKRGFYITDLQGKEIKADDALGIIILR